MANIARLGVVLGLNTAEFQSGLAGAMKGLDKLKTGVLAAGAAAITAGVGLAYLTKSALNTMDSLAKQAQMAGVTVEALSALSYSAELSGVSQENLTASMVKLTKGMSDARQGTGEALKGFQALGIDVEKLGSADGAMEAIAAQFSSMEDGANKTALAVALFGRSGAAMIPLLNGGADGLRKMNNEAKILGLVISTDTAKAAEVFNDSLVTMGKITTGLINKFAEGMLPALNGIMQGFFDAYLQADGMRQEMNDLIAVKMVSWAENLAIALAHIVDVGVLVARTMMAIGGSVRVVWADVNLLLQGLSVANKSTRQDLSGWWQGMKQSKAERDLILNQADDLYKNLVDKNAAFFTETTQQAVENARLTRLLPNDEDFGIAPSLKRTAPGMNTIDKAGDAEAKKMSLMLMEAQKLSAEYGREREHSMEMLRIKEQLAGLTSNERRVQEAVNEVLNATSKKLEEIASKREAAAGRGASSEVLDEYDKQSKAVQDLSEKYIELARAQETSSIQAQQTFSFGWNQAFRQYAEDAQNYATVGKDMFQAVTGAMTRAIDQFVESGKFSFKDFAGSVIKDLIRIQLQAQATALFNAGLKLVMGSFGGSIGGSASNPLSGDMTSMFAGMTGRAHGGTVSGGSPYMVGERGAELFMPSRSGTIIPNNNLSDIMGGGGVTYNGTVIQNMNAIDTQSGLQFLSKNKMNIYALNQSAGRSMPASR